MNVYRLETYPIKSYADPPKARETIPLPENLCISRRNVWLERKWCTAKNTINADKIWEQPTVNYKSFFLGTGTT